ncbi:MAG: secretin and TonB N-terminal domain-containing protein [Candidatus Omnitrophota bacterium]
MKKLKFLYLGVLFCLAASGFYFYSFAQQDVPPSDPAMKRSLPEASEVNQEPFAGSDPDQDFAEGSLSASENVTLDFKEADIQNVLKIISYKSGVNIVSTPDVIGNVTIKLVDVPWETALDVLLKTYGFGYQRQGNIILVTKMENISKIQAEEALQTEIFTLKFLDAQDAQKILIPLLSPRGKISVLYSRGLKGWQFGTFKIGKESVSSMGLSREREESAKAETISIERSATGDTVSRKAEFESSIKSKILVITDTAASLDRIRNVILPVIDKKPQQVLIETKLIEVNRNKLRDLGVDFGTGSTGAETNTPGFVTASRKSGGIDSSTIAAQSAVPLVKPSVFGALESSVTGMYPYQMGAEFIFRKLTGTNFEVILHALEEDASTNTLSSPKILTLDNQEASILVGFHTPILSSTVTAGSATAGTTATVTQTLDYYQEIGIRLNVVPQISEEGYINMIIHPSITSTTSSIDAESRDGAGTLLTSTSYPVIDVREAQTQVLLKDGETIVIGGLLKDVKSKQIIGVPLLKDIPFLGALFRRETYDTEKVDLLIFITAHIVKEGEFSQEEITKLEKSLSPIEGEAEEKAVVRNKKKK